MIEVWAGHRCSEANELHPYALPFLSTRFLPEAFWTAAFSSVSHPVSPGIPEVWNPGIGMVLLCACVIAVCACLHARQQVIYVSLLLSVLCSRVQAISTSVSSVV